MGMFHRQTSLHLVRHQRRDAEVRQDHPLVPAIGLSFGGASVDHKRLAGWKGVTRLAIWKGSHVAPGFLGTYVTSTNHGLVENHRIIHLDDLPSNLHIFHC